MERATGLGKVRSLESWMRYALFATALMNIAGAITFVPAFASLRMPLGLPEPHPFFLWTLAIWIGTFGVCYFLMAFLQRRDRLFIATAAVGKLSFFGLLLVYHLAGDIPALAAASAVPDLLFGSLFVIWLVRSSGE